MVAKICDLEHYGQKVERIGRWLRHCDLLAWRNPSLRLRVTSGRFTDSALLIPHSAASAVSGSGHPKSVCEIHPIKIPYRHKVLVFIDKTLNQYENDS
jgi:hypothetical protein